MQTLALSPPDLAAVLERDGHALAPAVLDGAEVARLAESLPDPGSQAGTRSLLALATVRAVAADARLMSLARLALGVGRCAPCGPPCSTRRPPPTGRWPGTRTSPSPWRAGPTSPGSVPGR
ncbi:hypothetical protein [Aerophototrophica crusticola]|uniref:hypothetical protein n=1 Tax=Aerophototrophica crusticola TaxID=1709002 RepID=UPI00384DCC76